MPKTYDEQIHDAQVLAMLRRCADALDAIAGTLAAIHDVLKPPVIVTPREAIDAVVANPSLGEVVKDAPTPLDSKAPKMMLVGSEKGVEYE